MICSTTWVIFYWSMNQHPCRWQDFALYDSHLQELWQIVGLILFQARNYYLYFLGPMNWWYQFVNAVSISRDSNIAQTVCIVDSIELMTSGTMVINHWLIVLYSHFLFKYIYNDLKIEMFLPINILIHYDFNCIRLLIFDPKRC